MQDKLESCMIRELCLDNCTAAVQLSIVNFLYCFEGENGRSKTEDSAKRCAGTAGIDFAPVSKCYESTTAQTAAYNDVVSAAINKGLKSDAKCLPWVFVDGVHMLCD